MLGGDPWVLVILSAVRGESDNTFACECSGRNMKLEWA